MEMLVIAVIAIGAFAAVLVPLFRRRPADTVGDEARQSGASGSARPASDQRTQASGNAPDDPVEAEVLRYRSALRERTLCRKCGQANPPGSRFCYECGARLPLEDAKEFE